jgi:uracil-DNA glycosylase
MNRKQAILQIIGIEQWQIRSPIVTTPEKNIVTPASEPNSLAPIVANTSNMDWETLKKTIKHCQKCALAKTRTQTVFGVGSEQAKLMVVGEAPGFHEDQQGKPFVGRAGQLLTQMLQAIDLTREQVFIANVLKCRPPNNRDPVITEVKQCTPYLQRQIAIIKPRVILALGRIAAQYLLNCDTPMRDLRGRRYFYTDDKIPLYVTYHPAYLLRSPQDKRKTLHDLTILKHALMDF